MATGVNVAVDHRSRYKSKFWLTLSVSSKRTPTVQWVWVSSIVHNFIRNSQLRQWSQSKHRNPNVKFAQYLYVISWVENNSEWIHYLFQNWWSSVHKIWQRILNLVEYWLLSMSDICIVSLLSDCGILAKRHYFIVTYLKRVLLLWSNL